MQLSSEAKALQFYVQGQQSLYIRYGFEGALLSFQRFRQSVQLQNNSVQGQGISECNAENCKYRVFWLEMSLVAFSVPLIDTGALSSALRHLTLGKSCDTI